MYVSILPFRLTINSPSDLTVCQFVQFVTHSFVIPSGKNSKYTCKQQCPTQGAWCLPPFVTSRLPHRKMPLIGITLVHDLHIQFICDHAVPSRYLYTSPHLHLSVLYKAILPTYWPLPCPDVCATSSCHFTSKCRPADLPVFSHGRISSLPTFRFGSCTCGLLTWKPSLLLLINCPTFKPHPTYFILACLQSTLLLLTVRVPLTWLSALLICYSGMCLGNFSCSFRYN